MVCTIMVLPHAIELVVQQDHNRERLLYVNWRVFVAYIDNAIGIGNRSIEAAVTASHGTYNNHCANKRDRQRVNLP